MNTSAEPARCAVCGGTLRPGVTIHPSGKGTQGGTS